MSLFFLPAQADPTLVPADQILASVLWDANGDGRFDRAVLVNADPDPVLHVFLSEGLDGTKHVTASHLAWAGAMWGTMPSLTATDKGSLLVKSENVAIGRDRWERTLTLSVREGKLIVSGYTWSSYDTLDLENTSSCDINLLTGKGTAKGKPTTVAPAMTPAADWTETNVPAACKG